MKLEYTVFSADVVKTTRTVDIDGEATDVQVDGLSVQLVAPGRPTLTLALTKAEMASHPFVVGEPITVTFGGAQ